MCGNWKSKKQGEKMDLPITSRFFQKLSLYREVRRQRRYKGRDWKNEEQILSWGADLERHKDHATPLTVQAVLSDPVIAGPVPHEIQDQAQFVRNRFGNLVSMGLATWSDPNQGGILLTQDGFLMGHIINEMKVRPFRVKWKYGFHYYLSWAAFYSGAVALVAEGLKAIWLLASFVHSIASGKIPWVNPS
jgi:hypothetical protein